MPGIDEISEAYHKAKADGSNPELVKAVEKLLGNPTEQQKTETEVKGKDGKITTPIVTGKQIGRAHV